MLTAEQIYQEFESLPENMRAEVLDYITQLKGKLVHRQRAEIRHPIWPQEVRALAGSWKNDFPTLEEIRATGSDSQRGVL